ncbi:MBL fold metallo-hydrolase [Saccharopolyspora endophytica]|uniref:MBL fold metallo-hydrolase n=1 Tax=Saccharopolyspora endophytica TaxID=543886 RepID=A0ABS5DGP3_9PSEU|nr:MBL fold metallo-hydrolase [Saccharopolyspora endophytica]MBQ0925465.1 MBL fold metallo-hydrolase [Saccharopolyspora endophytica]
MTTFARHHVQPDHITDLTAGFLTREVAPGVFVLTNGNYQSLFFTTGEGVVLVDAPEPLVRFIEPAVADVTDEPITTLIYSHGHSDHIGGAHLVGSDDLEIIAEKSTAEFVESKQDPRRPVPTSTFDTDQTIQKGFRKIQLIREGFHSAEGDVVVYLPEEKVMVAIDLIGPGWVPLHAFDITENMYRYLGAFDRLLAYDFEAFISGHTADVARRHDVEITKEYTFDVYETVKRIHGELNFEELLAEDRDNEQAGIKKIIDVTTQRATEELKSRWLDGPMKGVELWTESHSLAMVLYVRWTD